MENVVKKSGNLRINWLAVATSENFGNWAKVSDDEYTRQTRAMRGCYNITLSCSEMTVLSLSVITDRGRHNAKYRHFFVTSILVVNS